jgi:hypothetical protein
MALVDDLKDYVALNATTETNITEKHSVAIVAEIHAFLERTDSEIRTRATVRLLLELLNDVKYRYFANESYMNKGLVRTGVRAYVRDKSLPPAFDPKAAGVDLEDIAQRVLVRRYQDVLDFIRAHPRYILSIGTRTADGPPRDTRLAQHFFEEIADRKLNLGIPGLLLLGRFHGAKTADRAWATTRNILEKHGFSCVSLHVVTDFINKTDTPDDLVIPIGTELKSAKPADMIRLTSLVTKTPMTIPTDRPWTQGRPSPFRKVTFGQSQVPVTSQFEYIVVQKA